MNVTQFIVDLQSNLGRFELWWLRKHREEPSVFPEHMRHEGEWWEQYIAWTESSEAE